MGLTIKRKRERLITVAVLGVALLLDLAWAPPDHYRQMAQDLLGADGERIELESGPAFRAGPRWLLFFDKQGNVGPIRGAILIADEKYPGAAPVRSARRYQPDRILPTRPWHDRWSASPRGHPSK